MDRRTFLGSLIGTVTAVALLPKADFFAMTDKEPWQRVNLGFKTMFFEETSGLYLQGPAVATVVQSDFPDLIKFLVEPLYPSRPMLISNFILLNEQGVVLNEHKRAVAFKGDGHESMGVTYHCNKDFLAVAQSLPSQFQELKS